MVKTRILGTGSFTPERRLTNDDLSRMLETSDAWITERTGIKERRIAEASTTPSDLGAEAARRAIASADLKAEDIDHLIVATSAPDRAVPATAIYVQAKVGCFNAGAVDMLAACSGFLYALTAGWQAVASGQSTYTLVVGTETLSKITNWKDRNTCVLLGDGAGAVVLGRSDANSDILYSKLGADGRMADLIIVPSQGAAMMPTPEILDKGLQFIHMQGRKVYKFAVPKFVEIIQQALTASGLTVRDLALIIPHQMNLRMIEGVAQRLDIPMSLFFINIQKYGNTSSASIPLALDEAVREGRIQRGDLVLLTGMGAGLAWGTLIFRW